MNTVVVLGGGGREHALVWRIRAANASVRILCAPGNPGIAADGAECVDMRLDDVTGLAEWAARESASLAIVGPEAPLVDGVADALRARGVAVFGPSRDAARIEGSKIDAKEFMLRCGIPTARYLVCLTAAEAQRAVRVIGAPCVVKADGLAAGKGAFVCRTSDDALQAIDVLMVERRLDDAGARVVVEECLIGEEATVLAITDGTTWRLLPAARDHKRLLDGDRGPNTGGMGVIAPVPDMDRGLIGEVESRIIAPTIAGLAEEGRPFVGVLYAGLMLTDEGPFVIEYNCRFGDPEAEAVLPLLTHDPLESFAAAAEGRLARVPLGVREGAAHAVVLAAREYPERGSRGEEILGLAPGDGAGPLTDDGAYVFQAGTRRAGDRLETNGGRVLVVTGVGRDAHAARAAAQARIATVSFAGMRYRRDIGRVDREHATSGRES